MTDIINETYSTGEPEDLCISIFIALPKKPGAVKCELHRTISLMSHITKPILRIIMERVHSRIRPENGIEQCGFVEDSGTRNAIFMVRMISKRAIEKQRDVHMCFIEYIKAFDRVRHDELLKMLMNLGLYGKDIHLIWSLYWDQSACIRIENEMSEYTTTKRGLHQGCVLSPDLINLYSEMIPWENRRSESFFIGDKILTI